MLTMSQAFIKALCHCVPWEIEKNTADQFPSTQRFCFNAFGVAQDGFEGYQVIPKIN